jgi:hypothetical protein
MKDFYAMLDSVPFATEKDIDITKRVSPNLTLVNNILMDRLLPAGRSIGKYIADNYPKVAWLGKKLFRKKAEKAKYKYFSGLRSQEVFERYKTYHLITLRYTQE